MAKYTSRKWTLVPVEREHFSLNTGRHLLTIKDTHPGHGCSEVHPMEYSHSDALKILKFLNVFYTGKCYRFNWRIFW